MPQFGLHPDPLQNWIWESKVDLPRLYSHRVISVMGEEYCGKTVHFAVWDLYYLLIDSRFMHSIYSYLATFYPAVKGIRSNHWHFLYRRVTSARRYFFSFSMVAKEPIKLHPAEVQWLNRQNINLATPLNFCIRIPGKMK